MLWYAMQSVLMLLLAFVVGLIAGWLRWGRQWQPMDRLATTSSASPTPDQTPASPDEYREDADQPAAAATPDGALPWPTAATAATPHTFLTSVSSEVIATADAQTADSIDPGSPVPVDDQASGWSWPADDDLDAVEAVDARAADVEAVQTQADGVQAGLREASTGETDTTAHDSLVADQQSEGESDGHPAASIPEAESPPTRLLDDLTRIDGVSPAMAEALAAEGLGSYFSVANAREDQLRRALRLARIRSAPGIAFWSARAAELAAEAAEARAVAPPEVVGPPAVPPVEDVVVDVTDAAMAARRAAERDAAAAEHTSRDDSRPSGLNWLERRWQPPTAPAVPSSDVPSAPTPTPTVSVSASAAPTGPLSMGRPGAAGTDARARPDSPRRSAAAAAIAAANNPVSILDGDDDLEAVAGVGPRTADALRAAGLRTYPQLAAARDEELRVILRDAGLRFAPNLSTWSVQAALLLQGDVEGAATLAGGLMVGRERD